VVFSSKPLNNCGMTVPKIRLQFAKRLKEERQKSGLTQEMVAEFIGVSARYYQMLESKKPTAVKIDLIEKLARAFKITLSKLLNF
jgi:transcriptional regulator with XRE-family HTH domain